MAQIEALGLPQHTCTSFSTTPC